MKKYFIFISIIASFVIISCQKDNVGYLLSADASYVTDSLVVKSGPNLDTSKTENFRWFLFLNIGYATESQMYSWGWAPYYYGEDYFRNLKSIPWLGSEIEGIQGTQPIFLEIESVSSLTGNVDQFMSYAKFYGDGAIEIPFDHDVPPGRYVVSIKVKNIADEQIIYDAFTVIIEADTFDSL